MAINWIDLRNNQAGAQFRNLMGNLALSSLAHKRRMELVDKQNETRKLEIEEQRSYEETQAKKERMGELGQSGYNVDQQKVAPQHAPYQRLTSNQFFDPTTGKVWNRPPEETEKKGALLEQYEYAKGQFEKGIGEDPGSFTAWKKSTARAGATQLNIGEKLAFHAAKQKVTQEAAFKNRLRTPQFKSDIIKGLKTRIGVDRWEEMTPDEQGVALFESTGRAIKDGFPDKDVRFGIYKGKQGWWEFEEGKKDPTRLVKRWSDFVPARNRSTR